MSNCVLIVIAIPADDRQNDLASCSPSHESNLLESTRSKLEVALSKFTIKDITWHLNSSGTLWRVMFTCSVEESDGILEYLAKRCNIGSLEDTYVGIIPFSFFMKNEFLSNEVFDTNYDTSGESEDEFYFYSPKELQSSKKAQSIRCSPVEKEKEHGGGSSKRKDDRNEFKKFQERFLKSITARLTVAQVAASIKSGAELTFDFLLYIIMAAWIAAMGLMENSIVSLVASMLVSPLMGPVLAMTFGTIVRNKEIRNIGIRSASIGFLLCIVFGYVFGAIVLIFLNEWNSEMVFPTAEMKSRGELRVLWVGTLVALPSGAAVALSILSGSQSSLIGVAISASLLPPCVNAGILWSYATIRLIHSHSESPILTRINGTSEWVNVKPSLLPRNNYESIYFHDDISLECFLLGIVSLGLTAVNVISIFISAYVFLKIKEITPETALSPSTARFFKEDIPIARKYNRESGSFSGNLTLGNTCSPGANYTPLDEQNNLGVQILREWITANGLNEAKFFADDSPSARASQLQTLKDMLADVQADRVYQAIARGSNQLSQTVATPEALVASFTNGKESQAQSGSTSSSTKRRNTTIGSYHQPASQSVYTIDVTKIPDSDGDGDAINLHRRRKSSLALRKSLIHSEHSPLSVWPKARKSDIDFIPGQFGNFNNN